MHCHCFVPKTTDTDEHFVAYKVHQTKTETLYYTGILAPLLILIYINDLPLICPNANIQLFADDTVVSMSHLNYSELVYQVNHQILQISDWMLSNRLAVNASKCNSLLFSNRKATFEYKVVL